MDTRELTTFVTMCETLNYQRAGELLQYAPSTVFKHVQQLEAEIGSPLLVREGHTLRLTPEGKRFLPYAQRILAEYRAALGAEDSPTLTLTVGGCEMNTGNSLLDLLTRFAGTHPHIRMTMKTAPNATVPEMVREGQVDLGFFYSTGRQHRGLHVMRLYREPVYLVVSEDSPLAGRKGLRYEDLNGMEFVYPHDSCCFVTMLMPELTRRGVALKRVTYLGGMQLVVEQARSDNAVTLAPLCALPRFKKRYGLVRMDMQEEPLMAWETVLLGSHADMPAVQELLHFSLREAQRLVADEPQLSADAAPTEAAW